MTTAGGSGLDKMAMTHIMTRGWSMRATGGIASAHAVEVNIDTDGIILFMGGKDKVRGGEGFHEVIKTLK